MPIMNKLAQNNQQSGMVVLGDVRDSRLIADRPGLQTQLDQLVRRVNASAAGAIAVPFSIAGGDEIQGMLADPTALLTVINHLDYEAVGFSWRIGVGWGPLSTPLANLTLEMDGECFHHARRAIATGKKDDRWVTVSGIGEAEDAALNGVFRLLQVVRDGWTEKQRLAAAAMWRSIRDEAIPTQGAVADKLSLDKTTLSKMLKAAHYKQVTEMEEAMPQLLGKLLGGMT